MIIDTIRTRLNEQGIFQADTTIAEKQTVVGYDKRFKFRWFATQLNTFIMAPDYGEETVTVPSIDSYLNEAFDYAKANYKGWPRGLQSGMGVIAIFVSSSFDGEAIDYCANLKTGKKWAGFSIPVAANAETDEVTYFKKKPIWGKIYYPHFEKLITGVTS